MGLLRTAFLILLFALGFQGCTSLFYYPDKLVYRTPQYYDLSYKDVYFDAYDMTRLHAWHIYPKGKARGMLFVAHGNAQNLSSHFTSWIWLIEEGYELFIFDYRAYGQSEGEIDLEGSIEDTKAALDALQQRYDGKYWVCGQSLGGTLLINALQERDNQRIHGVIIDSTFTGFSNITREKLDSAWLTWPFQWIAPLSFSDDYDAIEKISSLNKPLLFLHGSVDTVISANHSWQLFEAALQPKELWLIKGAGHIQGFENPNAQEMFLEFLEGFESYYDPRLSRMKIIEALQISEEE